MNEKNLGGYTKAENIRRVINRLIDIRHDNEDTIRSKRAEVGCMVELEVIDDDQAQFVYDILDRVR